MTVETATTIADFTLTLPTGSNPKSEGDNHIRLIKTVLQNTFAGFAGCVLVTGTEAAGATASDYVVTVSPAPAAYANRMLVLFKATHTCIGASTLKVNSLAAVPIVGIDQVAIAAGDIENTGWVLAAYDSGATSAVLISCNDRISRNGDTMTGNFTLTGNQTISGTLGVTGAATLSSTLAVTDAATFASTVAITGTATGPTPTVGDSSTKLATTAFVAATSFTTNLPAQTGNSGKFIQTDGSTASWQYAMDHLALTSLGVI